MLYTTCGFEESKTEDGEPDHFFSGIPTPVGAILVILPLTHSFMGYDWAYDNLNFVAGYIILISGLLVSRIPTFSIKRAIFNSIKASIPYFVFTYSIEHD